MILNSLVSTDIAAAGLIFFIVFPLTNLKGFTVLVKLNSVGIACVLYIMGFIIVQSTAVEGIKLPVPPLQPKFYFLGGVMMLSFFIHSAIISIMKNNKNQEKNSRDLGIAFILVAVSYLSVGAAGYLAYHNRGEIPQDFLQIFDHTNIPALIARFALLFQLISVYPLLGMIVRIQVFGVLWKNVYPSWLHVLILNLFLSVASTLFAMFYPNVGTVLRFTGPVIGTNTRSEYHLIGDPAASKHILIQSSFLQDYCWFWLFQ
jgi:solute carrier family 38 (sodium-coupled neutral amino acid transporter), member 9